MACCGGHCSSYLFYMGEVMNERIKELLIQSEVFNKDGTVLKDVTGYELNKFANLVAAQEREACAKIADIAEPYKSADLIRARGTT